MADEKLAGAFVELRLETDRLQKDLKKVSREIDKATGGGGGNNSSGFGGKLSKSFSDLGKRAGQAFKAGIVSGAVASVAILGKSITDAGSFGEAQNVSKLIFGDAQAEVQAFAEAANKVAGLSDTAALQATSGFGGLLKNLGFARQETVQWSQDLTVLAADMGSAFDMDTTIAIDAISAGLRGEQEQLKKFNVFLSEADVKTEALNLGLIKQGQTLTNNVKAQARLSLILKQTNDISGDFANTLGESLPNQFKEFTSTLADGSKELGQEFLPVALEVLKWANEELPGALDVVIPKIIEFTDVMIGVGAATKDAFDAFIDADFGPSNDFFNFLTGKGDSSDAGRKELEAVWNWFKSRGREVRRTSEEIAQETLSGKDAYEKLQGTINSVETDPIDELADATDEATERAEAFQDRWEKAFDVFDGRASLAKNQLKLIDERLKIEKELNKDSSRQSAGIGTGTEDARENRKELIDLTETYLDVAEAMRDAGRSEEDVNQFLASTTLAIREQARAFGANTAEAENFTDTVLGIPQNISSTIALFVDDSELAAIDRELARVRELEVHIRTVGGVPGSYLPGVPSNHTGGFSNREHLSLLDRDEWVISSRHDNNNEATRSTRNSRGQTLDDVLGNNGGNTTISQTFVTPNFDEATLARFASQMAMEGAGV